MNDAQSKIDDTTAQGLTRGTLNLLWATLLSIFTVVSTPAVAAHKSSATESYFVKAPVLHVEPIVGTRYVDEPVQHCKRVPN